jgi:hypothetical protein
MLTDTLFINSCRCNVHKVHLQVIMSAIESVLGFRVHVELLQVVFGATESERSPYVLDLVRMAVEELQVEHKK